MTTDDPQSTDDPQTADGPGTDVPDAYETALDATERGRALAFEYKGLHRVVEPYAVGHGADGTPLLYGHQVEGETHDGVVPEEKLVRLPEVTGARVTDRSVAFPRVPDSPTHPRLERVAATVRDGE